MNTETPEVAEQWTRAAASLWSVPSNQQEETLKRLTAAGLEIAHWDYADGHFAQAGGFTPERAQVLAELAQIRSEAHLMVTDPLKHIDHWTSFCELVVVHIESHGWQEAIKRIEARGSRAALAISPQTPPSAITSEEMPVLVMSITPGQAGARFSTSAFAKTRSLHSPTRLVGLDGGVTSQLGIQALNEGANWLVSGTDLCSSTEPEKWLRGVQAF